MSQARGKRSRRTLLYADFARSEYEDRVYRNEDLVVVTEEGWTDFHPSLRTSGRFRTKADSDNLK